jgi:hypothetical protein
MTLTRDDLPIVLDYVDDWDVSFIWRAKNRADLDDAADGLVYMIGAVATPRNVRSMTEIAHATTSLVAYVIGSTYRLRIREWRELRELRAEH